MELKTGTETAMLPAQERELKKIIHIIHERDIHLRWFTTLLMLVFPTAVLFINRADSYSFWLLVLVGIWVWLRHGARPFLDRWSAALWIAFAIFFGVTVLAYLFGMQTEDGFHFLGRYLRFLFIAPVYLAFRRYPPTAKTVFIGLALGAFAGGVVSVWHFLHVHHFIRMEAATDLSIIFGDLATTMVLCTVAGFGLMAASRRAWSVPLLILCLAGGVAASMLSGTRGAWIPLLLLPVVLMTPIGGFLKRRYLFAIVLVLAAVFSSFYFMARSGTQERIKDMGGSLRDYYVAMHYFEEGTNQGFACDDHASFVKAWIHSGWHAAGNMAADVVHDPAIGELSGCADDYAVRLHNPGLSGMARYAFLRFPINGQRQQTHLLVRGTGTLSFDGSEAAGAGFDNHGYARIEIAANKDPGNVIVVAVPAGGTAWLVPLDGYRGEYSLSIADTSVGQRFELWRAAWKIFVQHPLLGVGTGAFQSSTNRLIAAGKIAPFIGDYDHPHNDFLNALASFGIVGFLALLGILLLPAWFFMRAVRSGGHVCHALGLAGILTVLGFIIYALTDVVFLHNMMIIWYVIYMALFFTLIQTQNEKQNNGSA